MNQPQEKFQLKTSSLFSFKNNDAKLNGKDTTDPTTAMTTVLTTNLCSFTCQTGFHLVKK